MKKLLCLLFSVSFSVSCFATLIQSSNRIDWVKGVNVGLQNPIPIRTNLLNVTQAPYNADNTGGSDAAPAIQSAINAAASNDVVYLPNGTYKLNSQLTIDKSFITLRGQNATNVILWGAGSQSVGLVVGHGPIAADLNRVRTIFSGATKGSTNLVLSTNRNAYGDAIKVTDQLMISCATREQGSDAFPLISVANYERLIKQQVVVSSVTGGTNITIIDPLVWNFTNSPSLAEMSTVSPPRQQVSLENFTYSLTNVGNGGSSGTATHEIKITCARNCILSNLNVQFANNYNVNFEYTVNCEFIHNNLHDSLTAGTSHGGLLLANNTGLLVEDNIIVSNSGAVQLYPGIEINDGVLGCVFDYNFFTNNTVDIDMHNSHPMMNLFEGNKFYSFFEVDGYFGSSSHWTLYRNYLKATTPFKRFTSYMQVVGDVVGDPTNYFNFVFSKEQANYGAPYPLFEMGYPNIGNSGYNGTAPPQPWNWPGNSSLFIAPFTIITNPVFVFTNSQGPTNILLGNFSTIPAPINAGYAVLFQHAGNTNSYFGSTNDSVLVTSGPGTSSNVTLVDAVGAPINLSVVPGDTLNIAGQNAYQWLQASNKYTHNFHGLLLYTNSGGTLVWDSGNADHTLPASLMYNSAPVWYGTNRWAAVDPENSSTPLASIPAEDRFNGINSSAPVYNLSMPGKSSFLGNVRFPN